MNETPGGSPNDDNAKAVSTFGGSRIVDAFLNSPLAGIAPWILMALFSGPGRFEEAVSGALGLSLLFFIAARSKRHSIKLLELFDIVFFGALAIVGLAANDATINWLELWAGELSNIALALFSIVSIAIRIPFTLQYAKEQTPQEYWDSPIFIRVNYMITSVWAGAFTFNALAGLYGDVVLHSSDNFWTGWILQLFATIFAISFTEWYPDYAPNKALQAAGEPTDPPLPIAKLFDWVPTFVIAIGIAGLVTDATPASVGIGLIVVGVLGTIAVRRLAPDAS
jgi:hypothetical protein